jgi:hypothetical protein
LLEILLDDVGDQAHARNVDHFDDWSVLANRRARINQPPGDEPIHRRGDDRVAEIDLQLVESRFRLLRLRACQIQLRLRRLVTRLGVVQHLLGDELSFEEALRAIEVRLRKPEIRIPLPDRGLRDFLCGLLLLDLLDEFEVFDLGNTLTARHPISEADRHIFQSSGRARCHGHCAIADQIADNGEFGGDRRAFRGGHFDSHRPTAASAATATVAPAPAKTAASETAPALEATATLATTASLRAGPTALRGGLGVRRFAEQASVIGPGNSGRGEDRNDYKLFHVALNDP